MSKTLVDLSYLRNFCDNDEPFLQEMIETFLEKIPEDLEGLQKAMNASDWTTAYQAVHGLKSSLYFIGMKDWSAVLAKLESDLSKQENIEESKKVIKELIPEAHRALKELEEMKVSK